jgi:hypothetical protein
MARILLGNGLSEASETPDRMIHENRNRICGLRDEMRMAIAHAAGRRIEKVER